MTDANEGGAAARAEADIGPWVERWLRDARLWSWLTRLVRVLVLVCVVNVARHHALPENADWRAGGAGSLVIWLAVGAAFSVVQHRRLSVRFSAELARDFPIGGTGRRAVLDRLAPGHVDPRDALGARVLRAYAFAAEASATSEARASNPAPSAEVEGTFAAIVTRLREGPPRASPGALLAAWLRDWRVLLFVALVGFALAKLSTDWRTLALELGAVVVVHEIGLVLAMRALGCRDARAFLLPFFATCVGDGPRGTPGQRGLALLLGPAPGIAIGAWLALAPPSWVGAGLIAPASLARVFLWFKLLQLLPFPGLDGGRLLELAFPRPRPRLEYAARWSALLALAAYGDQLYRRLTPRPSWTLAAGLGALVGLWVLTRARSALSVARAARALSDRGFPRGERTELPDESLRELFAAASTGAVWLRADRSAELERTMLAIHERAAAEEGSPLQLCWLAAAVCGLAALAVVGLAAA